MRRTLLGIVLAAAAIGAAPVHAAPSPPLIWGDDMPANLDPHAVFDVPSQFYLLNAYDGLYRYEGNPPKLVPWLAESHEVNKDGTDWTFKLRHGVKFHDGSELTAKDVVYSFQRLLKMGRGPSGAFKPVLDPDGVTAKDDYTVEFKLKKPYAPFLAAVPLVAIVNEKLVEAHVKDGDFGSGWLASNDAGSGAYIVDGKTYQPLHQADLNRFPDHFKGWKDNPRPIDVVHQRPSAETSTRILALLKGEVDATDSYLPADQVDRIDHSKVARVSKDPTMRVFVIRMNNSKPPFNNLNFRKCMSEAFNYDGFIKIVLKGYGTRNYGPIPNNLWGNPKDLKGPSFDLKKAKAFCDKAKAEGAPIDREIEIHTISTLGQTLQAAQLFQSDLHKIGIKAKIVPEIWSAMVASTAKPETTPDMYIHWVSTYFVDPENWIGQMYDSQFQGSWKAGSWYKNAEVDKLLREARAEPDQSKRDVMYQKAEKILVDDAVDIWIYNTIQLRGLSSRLKGYSFSPVGSGGEVRHMHIAQ